MPFDLDEHVRRRHAIVLRPLRAKSPLQVAVEIPQAINSGKTDLK